MDSAVTLDSFQLIVGIYLIYSACRGRGTLYNFFDIAQEEQEKVRKTLRMIYALCGILALAEVGFCAWCASKGADLIAESLVSAVSIGCTALIAVILVATVIWLRRKAT